MNIEQRAAHYIKCLKEDTGVYSTSHLVMIKLCKDLSTDEVAEFHAETTRQMSEGVKA